MIDFNFKGENFRVSDNLSYAQKVDACIRILSAKDARKNGNDNPAFEVDRMPSDRDSETPPRRRGRPRKVSAPITGEIAAGDVTGAIPAMPDNPLYAQGFYRVPCAVCGEGIVRTGARGRAPKYHAKCRPTESE